MKKFTTFCKNLWKDESGQGATEYIILLIVVVGIVFLFKGKIMGALEGRLNNLSDGLGAFTTDGGGQ